jgi:general secretion pathway protein D
MQDLRTRALKLRTTKTMCRRNKPLFGPSLLAMTFLCAITLPSIAQQRGGGGFGGGGAATSSGAGTRTYLNSTMVGEAMITSDPETRNLIIITDEETNENIKNVIESLDQPKPQVLINVVFLQVTHNDDLDFGVEGQFTHTSSSGNRQSGGTDFGIQAAQTALGGGFYRFISDDVDLMIRALQVAGKTEILSRPSILARNNQEAMIMVGQSVPFITNSRITDTGQTVNTVQYQDIGIILRVTPFITQEGLVEMILAPEISALSDQTVPISDTVNSPVIDKRSADTVVVTPSGKTIVIGGLIASQKVEQDRKVPILGDIPVLGWAFKRRIKKETKTELLIFMTPNVVQNTGEMAQLSLREADKLKMAPEVFKKEQLDRFVEGIPIERDEDESENEK